MVRLVEMSAYFTHGSIVAYVVEVGLEPVHEPVFGLTYILYPAGFAG